MTRLGTCQYNWGSENKKIGSLMKRAFEIRGLMRLVLFVLLIARLFERRMAGLAGEDTGYKNLDAQAIRSMRVGDNSVDIFTSLIKSGGS